MRKRKQAAPKVEEGEKKRPRASEITIYVAKPQGRPSSYDQTFCQVVIECGRHGMSRAQIAAELDVDRCTLRDWEADHNEFSAAMTRASDLALAWWESAGQRGMFMVGFSANAWGLQVRNRFREDYRDERKHEHKVDGLSEVMAMIDGSSRSLSQKG